MSKTETARPRLAWHMTNDGLKPTRAPHWFVARNPVTRVIPPGAELTMSLFVAASCPLLAFPTRSHQDDVTVPHVIPAGAEVTVTVRNKSLHSPLVLEDKEGLVNLCPLMIAADLEVSEE